MTVRNCELLVWISEDATRIVEKVQYEPVTNKLIGLILSLKSNGIPKVKHFITNSVRDMEQLITNYPVGSSAYFIMAQPLDISNLPFCLSIFGTDNKFKTDHVYNRWKYIYELFTAIYAHIRHKFEFPIHFCSLLVTKWRSNCCR